MFCKSPCRDQIVFLQSQRHLYHTLINFRTAEHVQSAEQEGMIKGFAYLNSSITTISRQRK